MVICVCRFHGQLHVLPHRVLICTLLLHIQVRQVDWTDILNIPKLVKFLKTLIIITHMLQNVLELFITLQHTLSVPELVLHQPQRFNIIQELYDISDEFVNVFVKFYLSKWVVVTIIRYYILRTYIDNQIIKILLVNTIK